MVIGREDALRITEAIFMLTSEFNRVFSLNSLRVLTGDYYGDAVNWLIENGLATRVNDRYLRVTVPRLRLLAVAGGELVVRHVDDLSWSEFEEFISFTLNQAGYQTLRGVRLTVGGVRGEFDVIGYRGEPSSPLRPVLGPVEYYPFVQSHVSGRVSLELRLNYYVLNPRVRVLAPLILLIGLDHVPDREKGRRDPR